MRYSITHVVKILLCEVNFLQCPFAGCAQLSSISGTCTHSLKFTQCRTREHSVPAVTATATSASSSAHSSDAIERSLRSSTVATPRVDTAIRLSCSNRVPYLNTALAAAAMPLETHTV